MKRERVRCFAVGFSTRRRRRRPKRRQKKVHEGVDLSFAFNISTINYQGELWSLEVLTLEK